MTIPSSLGRTFTRTAEIARAIGHELRGGLALTSDLRSSLRYSADVVLSRLTRYVPFIDKDRERSIRVRGGVTIWYRLNRGDMQSIREVWIDECYRLPFDNVAPAVVVDLGANIGLTSLWLARRYGSSTVIAVEPSPENARLARLNLEQNNVQAEVVEAAIGPRDGQAFFAGGGDSNLGHVGGDQGTPVSMLSMQTLLQRLPDGAEVDLVKMDIEGGEGPLVAENVGWLRRVKAIIAELHPDLIDYQGVIRSIEQQGFRYLPAHAEAAFVAMDSFVRNDC